MNQLITQKRKGRLDLRCLEPNKKQSFDLFSLLEKLPNSERSIEVFGKVKNADWLDERLKDRVVEHTNGFIQSSINNLSRQAGLHLKEVERTYNFNSAQVSVDLLRENDCESKIFAVNRITGNQFQVKAPNYIWQIIPIDLSEEIIPSEYLRRLTLIRANNLEPSGMFIGFPFESIPRQSTLQILTRELNRSLKQGKRLSGGIKDILKNTLNNISELVKIEDPVLLLSFGTDPGFLVEVARWI